MAIYTFTNKIKFTSISEKYAGPRTHKAKLSEAHSSLIAYVCSHFSNTKRFKQRVVDALNTMTYFILTNQILPLFDWSTADPLSTMPEVDQDVVKNILKEIYLTVDAIEWDVEPVSSLSDDIFSDNLTSVNPNPVKPILKDTPKPYSPISKPVKATTTLNQVKAAISQSDSQSSKYTQKEDLYIKSPTYPQFDYNKPWLSQQDGPDKLVIYTTLPEIPTKQNEISITTDVSKFTDSELYALYPNKLIRTRASVMYEPVEGIKLDDDLGLILPIEGFSEEDIVDNIIRYPHFYKLQRIVDGVLKGFYFDIEIDGKLYPVEEVWDDLPEAQIIPKQSEYIKEYVVRRYLLERDKGIIHNYPMYGTLNEFLTLFMPSENYIAKGYADITNIAKQCVASRVSFKRSRNPILRRLGLNV